MSGETWSAARGVATGVQRPWHLAAGLPPARTLVVGAQVEWPPAAAGGKHDNLMGPAKRAGPKGR